MLVQMLVTNVAPPQHCNLQRTECFLISTASTSRSCSGDLKLGNPRLRLWIAHGPGSQTLGTLLTGGSIPVELRRKKLGSLYCPEPVNFDVKAGAEPRLIGGLDCGWSINQEAIVGATTPCGGILRVIIVHRRNFLFPPPRCTVYFRVKGRKLKKMQLSSPTRSTPAAHRKAAAWS